MAVLHAWLENVICNIRKGNRVAPMMVNSVDFCASFYFLGKMGAVPTIFDKNSKFIELFYPLVDSDLKVLLHNGRWCCKVK